MINSRRYKIAVITPIRNSENHLKRSVTSLLKQELENIQYIFIDDHSTDKSFFLLNNLLAQFHSKINDCIVIRQKKHEGVAFCRRLGINLCNSEYIAFCDSDDYVEPDMYQKLYQKAVETEADIITCGYFIEGTRTETKIITKPYGIDINKIYKNMYKNCEIALWDKLFRRDLLVNNNIYPLEGYNYYEDCFITIKSLYFAKKIVTTPYHLYHYVDHSDSSSKKNVSENLKSMRHYIEELDIFFKNQNANTKIYKTLINRLKFQYKLKLKQNKLTDRKDWYNIFKECHSQILKFSDIPLLGRLKLYFLINLKLY